MSPPHIPPGSVDALSEKELEILRLLATGHTAKSIAARLGRTETSINERLRDARRKTGVGSSRELARQLNAQKIWDKNIDLSPPGSLTDTHRRLPQGGRTPSKGTMLMLMSLSLAAAGLAFLFAGPMPQSETNPAANVAASRQSPLVGRWSLDVNRIPMEERPQGVTIVFDVSHDQQWTTRVEIVGPDGKISHAQSTAALDGAPVAITGNMEFIDTVSLRQPAPGTLVMTLGKNGAPVSTRVYTVAKDNKSMTETIVWAGKSIPGLQTTHFNRTG